MWASEFTLHLMYSTITYNNNLRVATGPLPLPTPARKLNACHGMVDVIQKGLPLEKNNLDELFT